MPNQILLRARKSLVFHGRSVAAGATLRTSPVEAASLVYQHKAEFAEQDQDDQDRTRKKRYRRRDLRAES